MLRFVHHTISVLYRGVWHLMHASMQFRTQLTALCFQRQLSYECHMTSCYSHLRLCTFLSTRSAADLLLFRALSVSLTSPIPPPSTLLDVYPLSRSAALTL